MEDLTMNEEYNSKNEKDIQDVKPDHVSELHKNQDFNDKIEGKDMQVPKRNVSPYSVVGKALPLAFGLAAIGIIITLVLYLLLK